MGLKQRRNPIHIFTSSVIISENLVEQDGLCGQIFILEYKD